jgi:hypothetical protein
MNGARASGCPRRHLSLVGLMNDPGTAYCVPEAGINYKRQMTAQISDAETLAGNLAKSALMS